MDQKYVGKFNRIYDILDKIEDEVMAIKESLEKNLVSIQTRIDTYDMKDTLTDRQEEIYDNLDAQVYDVEEEVEIVTNFLEHIDEAISLISFDLDQLKQRTAKLTKIQDSAKLKLEYLQRKQQT